MYITDVEEISEELQSGISDAMSEAESRLSEAVDEHNDAIYQLEQLMVAIEKMNEAIGENL